MAFVSFNYPGTFWTSSVSPIYTRVTSDKNMIKVAFPSCIVAGLFGENSYPSKIISYGNSFVIVFSSYIVTATVGAGVSKYAI